MTLTVRHDLGEAIARPCVELIRTWVVILDPAQPVSGLTKRILALDSSSAADLALPPGSLGRTPISAMVMPSVGTWG